MSDSLEQFQKFRADLNEEIQNCGHLKMKRFFALDHQTYQPEALGGSIVIPHVRRAFARMREIEALKA